MKPIKVNAVPVQPITLSVVYNNGEGYEITLHEYLSRITSRIATLEHQVEIAKQNDPSRTFTVEEVEGLRKELLAADALSAGYRGIFDNFLKEPK